MEGDYRQNAGSYRFSLPCFPPNALLLLSLSLIVPLFPPVLYIFKSEPGHLILPGSRTNGGGGSSKRSLLRAARIHGAFFARNS